MLNIARAAATAMPFLRPTIARCVTIAAAVAPGHHQFEVGYDRDIEAWLHRWPSTTLVDSQLRGYPPDYFESRLLAHPLEGLEIPNGGTVLELGAGTGTETIFLSRLVGEAGQVLAVEAHPRTFSMLCRAIDENGLRNVHLVEAFAGGTSAATTYLRDGVNHHSNSQVANGASDSVAVAVRPLDDIARLSQSEVIDLLKVNIEGAEAEVLSAASATLARTRQVTVSCHDFKSDGDPGMATMEEVQASLRSAGFKLLPSTDDGTWRTSYVRGVRR